MENIRLGQDATDDEVIACAQKLLAAITLSNRSLLSAKALCVGAQVGCLSGGRSAGVTMAIEP